MKIQLASTLPFTPVQLDPGHQERRRVVGTLTGLQGELEIRTPVYEFRHDENDAIQYRVDLYGEPVWIDHNDTLNYKPYAFVVMDAITRLVGAWDGIVYRTPSGERLRESAFQATLQIVDACVSPTDGLWVMVSISGESFSGLSINSRAVRQLGWVPVAD